MSEHPTPAAAPAAPGAAPRRRTLLPRIIAVAVLVGAVVALVRLDVFGGGDEPTAAERTATISADLKQRMTTALEQMPVEGHAGHGATGPAELVCGARVYGYEPATAKSVKEVKRVYGFHMCATADPGTSWKWAPKLVAPLVWHLDRQPPAFDMVQSTATASYRERLTQVIPERYQAVAQEGALEPDTMAELQRRFAAAAVAPSHATD